MGTSTVPASVKTSGAADSVVVGAVLLASLDVSPPQDVSSRGRNGTKAAPTGSTDHGPASISDNCQQLRGQARTDFPDYTVDMRCAAVSHHRTLRPLILASLGSRLGRLIQSFRAAATPPGGTYRPATMSRHSSAPTARAH